MKLLIKRKKLKEAYKAQLKHLEEREKELKTELKAIKTSNKKVKVFKLFKSI